MWYKQQEYKRQLHARPVSAALKLTASIFTIALLAALLVTASANNSNTTSRLLLEL
jgi:multisubunit Na+/H+ antiporter MnhC subunit